MSVSDKEKKISFAEDPIKALHSPGMYYIKRGKLLKKYYRKRVEDRLFLSVGYASRSRRVSFLGQWGKLDECVE